MKFGLTTIILAITISCFGQAEPWSSDLHEAYIYVGASSYIENYNDTDDDDVDTIRARYNTILVLRIDKATGEVVDSRAVDYRRFGRLKRYNTPYNPDFKVSQNNGKKVIIEVDDTPMLGRIVKGLIVNGTGTYLDWSVSRNSLGYIYTRKSRIALNRGLTKRLLGDMVENEDFETQATDRLVAYLEGLKYEAD